jgi:dihydrofolate reductase
MGIVLASHSMSLDGFIAQPNGKAGPLHEWLFTGDRPSRHYKDFRLSENSRMVFDQLVDRIGATVAGRRTYEDSAGWGGRLPFDWPFFVVTHEAPRNAAVVPFEFIDDGVERAVELAKEAAGDKDVSVMGGDIIRQCLAAGLLDEIEIDLVPVFLGEGVRLFDEVAIEPVTLEPTRIVEAPGVTHLSYRVAK